jgi:uncharacterized protein (TIGR00297 family)
MPISYLQLLAGFVIAGIIAYLALREHLLARSGAWAAFILGTVVFGLGGIDYSVPLITFFITGSLLSKYGPKRKRSLEEVFEKGSTRDAGQVVANGGVAGVLVIVQAFLPPDPPFGNAYLFTAYLGALAAAAADTWGTELGVLARGRTIGLPSLKPVPRGTSGGVSWAGTLAALCGAVVVAASGFLHNPVVLIVALPATLGGVTGMFADSIAGGVLQARYRCTVCDAVTERSIHCDTPAHLVGGRRAITNDIVNIICTIVGALASVAFLKLVFLALNALTRGVD